MVAAFGVGFACAVEAEEWAGVYGAAGIWTVLQPYSGGDGAGCAGGHGGGFDDAACADTADDDYGLPADYGGAAGVWISVRLYDGAAGGGGADEFGDGVCERL